MPSTLFTSLRARFLPGRHPRLQVFLFCIVAWCVSLLFHGLATYPDAPYKPCFAHGEFNGRYCGKRGSIPPQETVAAWKHWEGLLFASWPFGILAGVALGRLRKEDHPI